MRTPATRKLQTKSVLIDRRAALGSLMAGATALSISGVGRLACAASAPDEGRSHRLRIRGAEIHYREWGDKASQPLLLLHPAPLNSHIWVTLAPVLARRYRVIAPDARGFGDSAWSNSYDPDGFLADLEGVIADLKLTRPILCGNSMGGTLAFMYAGMHPRDVDRLILLDTGPGERPGTAGAGGPPVMPAPNPPGPFESPAAAAALIPSVMGPGFIREMSEHNLRRAADGRWEWKFDFARVMEGAAKSTADPRKWPVWEAVACPTLVLRGERSPAFPARLAEQMVAGRRHVELVVIPGAGHFIPLEAPEALESALIKWLQL